MMDSKIGVVPTNHQPVARQWARHISHPFWLIIFVVLAVFGYTHYGGTLNSATRPFNTSKEDFSWDTTQRAKPKRVPETIEYHLRVSNGWRNPDGGHWRPVFLGNSQSPMPTIDAVEGDTLKIVVHNDNLLPISLHWVGVHFEHGQTWHDGSSGVTQSPILSRANRTVTIETAGQWGLKWFLDHTSTPTVDGNYGTIWILPGPDRERPYHLVSGSSIDIQNMMNAERTAEHLVLYNWQHKPMDWLLAQLQGEGYDPYCFNSILVNGKGRVHCRPDDLNEIDGNEVDANACVLQASGAVAYDTCAPSTHDYEIIETKNRRWIMLNFVNPGLEHPYRISIDDHDMWVVADDGGFVRPQRVDAITVTNAERITVMVKLDKDPADYAIRIYALSRLQFIQTYAILRYPHRETGRRLGEPIPRPQNENSVLNLDGTVKDGATLLEKSLLHPYPQSPPPQGKADITLRFRATGAPDPYNPYVTNCSLNGAPWQIFRGLREPLNILGPKYQFPEPNPIVTGLPLGSTVDIVVENDLPVTLPMYKHNDPVFRLGSGEGKFRWDDVADAEKHGQVNLQDPPRSYVHELPASGWLALRWRIEQSAMTMFHVFRVRYFVLGMQVPMFEGDDHWPEVPDEVKEQPRVEFELPEHMGIFD